MRHFNKTPVTNPVMGNRLTNLQWKSDILVLTICLFFFFSRFLLCLFCLFYYLIRNNILNVAVIHATLRENALILKTFHIMLFVLIIQKQPLRGVPRKRFLKTCSKFKGEHPYRCAISIMLLCNFIEISLRHECSPVNLLYIFRTSFLKNTFGWLLPIVIFVIKHLGHSIILFRKNQQGEFAPCYICT